jgi:hypothetical protein
VIWYQLLQKKGRYKTILRSFATTPSDFAHDYHSFLINYIAADADLPAGPGQEKSTPL